MARISTHKAISFVKSTIRIFGYFALSIAFGANVVGFAAASILVLSEVLGIIEEVGE